MWVMFFHVGYKCIFCVDSNYYLFFCYEEWVSDFCAVIFILIFYFGNEYRLYSLPVFFAIFIFAVGCNLVFFFAVGCY